MGIQGGGDGLGLAQWRGLIGEIRDFVEDGAGSWLLEDGWDFHTWIWVGKALGKVCLKHRYVDREEPLDKRCCGGTF